ncbi:MAG: DNA mismatch repair protein MutS [Oscillospiraceae bacterium]|nr:DNA mismatch repair protein MutS [Oscillospiraceae bacterium]
MSFPFNNPQLSPMMRQYLEVKQQHMDKLLMYRLGDFYEMFFDDAVTASRELELTLTGRECGLPDRAPMCGVPYHAVDSYISRLVEKGYKVVICEQMEDPALAKGLVKRDIVRIITPGTLTDTDYLEDSKHNYLCACCADADGKDFGIAFVDITTGNLILTEVQNIEALINELSRFEPKEVLINDVLGNTDSLVAYLEKNNKTYQILTSNYFVPQVGKGKLSSLFSANQLNELKKSEGESILSSACALIMYLDETQFSGVSRICSLECYRVKDYMLLPLSCKRNLELTQTMRAGDRKGSLLWAIDRTSTAMGHRLLRSFLEKPLISSKQINARLDAVQEFYANSVLSGQISDSLKGVYDIERIMTRIVYGKCVPRDLVGFSQSAARLKEINIISKSFHAPLLKKIASEIDPFDDIRDLIQKTIVDNPPALLKDGGYIRQGFNQEIDELRDLLFNTKQYLAKLEQKIREETGIKNIRVGYNKVFGYYFEVSKGNLDLVPDTFIRKQTLVNGERYITEELKDLENKILSSGERIDLLERQAFDDLCNYLQDNILRIQKTAYAVSYLDFLCSLGELARDNHYCRPVVDDSDVIDIENGRHPVVERVLRNEYFVPNDTYLDCDQNLVHIITGPNMAGKSTYMRQVSLITIMAQIGSFVPAKKARIGVVDGIFTRVGASDDLFSGDSTFMVEMKEVAEILSCATKKSLVILDEIGRGTSTFDGMSIARATIEYICKDGGIGCKTLFATHYHELTDMDADFSNVKNYNIAAKKRGDSLIFLRRIVSGPTDDSYGIEVAQLAGVPEEVSSRAKEILHQLETANPDHVERKVVTSVNNVSSEIEEELKKIHIETLTPIEAMSILHSLIQKANEGSKEDI